MKIALAQLNYHIGNFDSNVRKIIQSIQTAEKSGADLVVFAELAISGYPPRDFLEFDDFIKRCHLALDEVKEQCQNIAAIVGLPTYNESDKGKPLYNSAAFIADGKVKKYIHKSLLPNYDIFDEYRYFEPNKNFDIIECKGHKIALTICEDLWNIQDNPLYTINPMDELSRLEPEMLINIAASPFNYHQIDIRTDILRRNAVKYGLPLFYVNHVGAQTELIFDGGSLVMNSKGEIVEELPYFGEGLKVVDLNAVQKGQLTYNETERPVIGMIHDALVMGIRNYFVKLGFKKAIIGLSGGIDSALTAVLAAEALGNENVYNVLMPSEFSSTHSVKDAIELAENLQMPYDKIPIQEAYKTIEGNLKPYFKDLSFGLTEENIQARIRGVLLMALSNKFGYILLNTSNKSEVAVGYSTLYGDMNGGLSVLGDVYKTQVFELAKFININKEIIPLNIINKAPSAELRPNQKDTDSLPDYHVLDEILYMYIEKRLGPKEIIELGYDASLVHRILRLVNISEYKRYQTPPILRVSSKAFGMGRRMPIVAKYLS